ncbi:MAG: hypothetical protein CMO55_13785 [Verrucomicrobiales bacterium]|nr:hypothetical protein [Verrucomicrobiales bacterium]
MSKKTLSFIAFSLSQAGRVVDQLKAAGLNDDEIFFMTPEGLMPDEKDLFSWSRDEPVLITVLAKGFGRIGMAGEIFARAAAESEPVDEHEYETPEFWRNSILDDPSSANE